MRSQDLIREARKRAGLSQAELAARAGTQQPAISRWERGDAEPGFDTLRGIVDACGLSLTVGLAAVDDSYLPQIERTLRLTPLERVQRAADAAAAGARLRAAGGA